VVATATVFAGTMAPLISDALGLGTLSVGTQYFNPTFLLPTLPLIALAAVGLHASWKKGRLGERRGALLVTLAMGVLLAVAVIAGASGGTRVLTPVGLALGGWLMLSSLVDPVDRLRRRLSLTPSIVGMAIAHAALGLFVISLTAVETYTAERDVAVGETAQVGIYEYRFLGLQPVEGPNYDGVRGEIAVFEDGKQVALLHPEKRQYWVQQSVMTEAGIDMKLSRDIFAALGEDLGSGRWSVRAQVRPMINYVWFAALLMAIGGIVAACDRRYRQPLAAREPAGPATAGGPGAALPGRAG
jgi:cytochrome c-type biogenesis protein CcmF